MTIVTLQTTLNNAAPYLTVVTILLVAKKLVDKVNNVHVKYHFMECFHIVLKVRNSCSIRTKKKHVSIVIFNLTQARIGV